MSHANSAAVVHLARGQSLALPDIRGTALMVQRGTLWITQENDTQDVTLREGDLWMVSRDGLTIIEAQNDASMQALGPAFERATSPRHAWWHRLGAWLRDRAAAAIDAGGRNVLRRYY